MISQRLRDIAIILYLVGNALTYSHLARADRVHAVETRGMVRNLALSSVWPLYWPLRGMM
jgi:hypothetical protein